jgi:hypothetical protein
MNYRLRIVIQISLFIIGVVTITHATAQQTENGNELQANPVLGVLEDIPGLYSGKPDFRVVRAAFKKVGDHWEPFPTQTKSYLDLQTLPKSYPKEMKWTIAFDGRNLGTIISRTPSRFEDSSEIGIEQITSHGQVQTVGNKSIDYAVFRHTPVYRPLVAVSHPNFADPDQWKAASLSLSLVSAAREQFRNKFPKVSNCKSPEENIPRPWSYRDEDVKVAKAYSSKNGWSVIELNLTGNCDGDQGQDAFHGQWFAIDPSGPVKFLGEDMWLVDAGDYDNDGMSEILFSIDGDHTAGYRLFYQEFRKSAEFVFNYY